MVKWMRDSMRTGPTSSISRHDTLGFVVVMVVMVVVVVVLVVGRGLRNWHVMMGRMVASTKGMAARTMKRSLNFNAWYMTPPRTGPT